MTTPEAYKNVLVAVRQLYGDREIAPCPFLPEEVAELEASGEMLVYVPAGLSAKELCQLAGLRANVDFDNEAKMIRNVMVNEAHWFITAAASAPELLYRSGQFARRLYEDEGLHGLDLRRYLAFCASYRQRFDHLPDQAYWTFLLSGSYDRSGTSIVGFDAHGVLSHHGWMRNFRAKFVGSRYAVLAPRIEITPETARLVRARRGRGGPDGAEASME
jgi:hypothetical protein